MPNLDSITVRCEERAGGSRVIVIKDGVAVLDLPWQIVKQVCQAMRSQAKLAEAADKRDQLVVDQAILSAFGAKFGLSDDSLVKKEAAKKIGDIRRKIGKTTISSTEVLGAPTLVQSDAKCKTQ